MAELLDQTRVGFNGWRADESAPGPSWISDLRESLSTAIRHGDVPSTVYLLEEEQVQINLSVEFNAPNGGYPRTRGQRFLELCIAVGGSSTRLGSSRFTVMR